MARIVRKLLRDVELGGRIIDQGGQVAVRIKDVILTDDMLASGGAAVCDLSGNMYCAPGDVVVTTVEVDPVDDPMGILLTGWQASVN